jgi:alcohol dehydrogenase
MGVHHGLAQQLGGRTGIPHGLANALVLPHAIRFNQPVVPEAVEALAGAMAVDDAAAAVEALRSRAGLPSRLRDAGVTEEDLDAVARLSQGNASVQRNPRPVSEDDARAILAAAY